MAVPNAARFDVGHHSISAGEACVVEAIGAQQRVDVNGACERALEMSGARLHVKAGVTEILARGSRLRDRACDKRQFAR